jgi:hypothetical protein
MSTVVWGYLCASIYRNIPKESVVEALSKIQRIAVIFTLLSINLFSQSSQFSPGDFTKPIQILPPSPNAASLGKYGGIDVGFSSGAANFVIPIGNYTSRDISVAISLNYTSTGFKSR